MSEATCGVCGQRVRWLRDVCHGKDDCVGVAEEECQYYVREKHRLKEELRQFRALVESLEEVKAELQRALRIAAEDAASMMRALPDDSDYEKPYNGMYIDADCTSNCWQNAWRDEARLEVE